MTEPLPQLSYHPATSHQPWQNHLWSSEQFFINSNDYFQSVLDGINTAKNSVIIATYIFDYDRLGKQVIDALGRAKARGVNVRVLIDGFGSFDSADRVIEDLTKLHVDIKVFHPLPWQSGGNHHSLHHGSRFANILARFLKINHRHHAKIYIVDQIYLWSGSQNISMNHIEVAHGGGGWHDYSAMVSGKAVEKVSQLFDDFWFYRKPHLGHGLFEHYWNNLTAITRRRKNRLLVTKFDQAQQTLWIINPYFSPTRSIIRALRRASRRGVDVRIIVPNRSDIGFFPLLTATYYDELIKDSVRIFEYLPSILHAKMLIVDDFRLLGSTNLNHRSLLHDIEFDIVLESPEVQQQSYENFLNDQQQCREICTQDLNLFGWRRLLGLLPWTLRYWL